jgi:ComF family protein
MHKMDFSNGLRLLAEPLHKLLSNHCYLCGDISREFLCPGCRGDLPVHGTACRCCALPVIDKLRSASENPDALLCGDCLKHPKPFDRTLAAFTYAHPLDFLINRFKHHRQFVCGDYLSKHLISAVQAAYGRQSLPDLLLPMPLHWTRHFKRGFNQSHAIAHQLHKKLSIPLAHHCRRLKHNPRQQGLKRKERLRNLTEAFTVSSRLDGYHVALIDDVMTTGATATELSHCLRQAGAAKVDVWVLARVV